MSAAWYIHDSRGQHGPFDDHELHARLKDYIELGDVHVWRDGFEDWVPAATFLQQNATPAKLPRVKGRWALYGLGVGIVLVALAAVLSGGPLARYIDWSTNSVANNVAIMAVGVVSITFYFFLAGLIADIFSRPKKTQGNAVPHSALDDLASPEHRANHRFNNFIARNWRGEYPLWVSYWIVGIGTNVAAVAIPLLLALLIRPQNGFWPIANFAFFASMWAIIALALVWQCVGVWRSANVRIAERAALGKGAPWAGLAKFVILIAVLQNIGTFIRVGVPQLSESVSVAFMNDPDIPDYTIHLLNGGTEIEVIGGIKYGLAEEFKKVLKASRQVRVVHLDSVGGRLGEGAALNAVIKENGLTTFVATKCMSACTLAFAGGKQRILKKGAVLGFHRGAFGGEDQVDDHQGGLERRIFLEAGFSRSFIDKALSTPNKEMWTPPASELLAQGVITSVNDGEAFAISGYGASVSREVLDQSLQKAGAVYVALKERFPDFYNELVEQFYAGISKGEPEGNVIQGLRAKMFGHIHSLLPQADDAVLIGFANLAADQYEMLGRSAPAACYAYASGEGRKSYAETLSPDLVKRELALDEQIVKTATKRPPGGDSTTTWTKIGANLAAKGVSKDDFALMSATNLEPSKHARYCDVMIGLYRTITGLPSAEAAIALRDLFSGKM
jgi:GYF domain 2